MRQNLFSQWRKYNYTWLYQEGNDSSAPTFTNCPKFLWKDCGLMSPSLTSQISGMSNLMRVLYRYSLLHGVYECNSYVIARVIFFIIHLTIVSLYLLYILIFKNVPWALVRPYCWKRAVYFIHRLGDNQSRAELADSSMLSRYYLLFYTEYRDIERKLTHTEKYWNILINLTRVRDSSAHWK